MNIITFSGSSASGKTSVITLLSKSLQQDFKKVGVIKIDCISTNDDEIFNQAGIISKKGISGDVCPDHFFVSNFDNIAVWGKKNNLDYLITESAGLCNRCSPYIKNILAVCVLDNLSGIDSPQKNGPMLRLADIVVVTKSDLVSQSEREVFMKRIHMINPNCKILKVNSQNHEGISIFKSLLIEECQKSANQKGKNLRYPMPSAICSYCLGEKSVRSDFKIGNYIDINL